MTNDKCMSQKLLRTSAKYSINIKCECDVIGTLLYNFHGQSISSFRGMQLITKNHIFPRSDADNSLLNGAKSLCPTTLLKIKD